jgi:predicted PurR-regulated permease PerM
VSVRAPDVAVPADRLGDPSARSAPPRRARRGPQVIRSTALTGLFALACLYTIAFAKPFLRPLAITLILYFLLNPAVRFLARFRIPRAVGALVVLGGFLTVSGVGLYRLSKPAAHWIAQAPQSIRTIQARAKKLAERFQNVTRTAQQVERMTEVTGANDTQKVELREPGLGAAVFGGVQTLVGDLLVIFTLLFFMLASGDLVIRKFMGLTRRIKDKEAAADIARELERKISGYIVMTTAINATFGLAVGLAMWWLGLPNPLLWGTVAGVTNFVPYLGGMVCLVALSLAAMLTFTDVWYALLVPLVFFALNTLEGYVVTPLIMGRKLTLNTPVLFIGLLFWWWVWGTAGALLAVPLMATIKIVADRIDALAPLAEFLGDEESESGA